MTFRLKYILLLAILITGAYVWWILFYVPFTWEKYTVSTSHLRYSVSYPKGWILNTCGNGEIAVTQKPISKCLRPLQASQIYIDNLYFQIFLPEENYLTYRGSERTKEVPFYLNSWKTVSRTPQDFFGYKKMSGSMIPLAPKNTNDYVMYSEDRRHAKYVLETEKRELIAQLPYLLIGFNDNNLTSDQKKWIVRSLSQNNEK